ncbi:MAG: A/G-specific adenine glycosylase [Jatrophihabitans sp.]|uniref:A/G-specific adenine glycosylase n=1 Tax=Jatrophihabitans sp. TaxID=1932789 RepID=UPI003F7FF6EA
MTSSTTMTALAADTVLDWYRRTARDLPWRRPGVSPWAVLVSEIMLQQTQVSRVLPAYAAWLARWPTPAAQASEPVAEAIRQWGRLGYPRRAMRLHAAAVEITERFDGVVPREVADLLSLPGVGEYTARAVAAFAFRQRQPVVDTNVRRVVARAVSGLPDAGAPSTTRDLAAMTALLPPDPETAAIYSVAVMELGALVCTAAAPRCGDCPVSALCAWRRAGSPPAVARSRPVQRFEGTDRQVRGRLMARLREAEGAVPVDDLRDAWPDDTQRERCLASLLADGLAHETAPGCIALGGPPPA